MHARGQVSGDVAVHVHPYLPLCASSQILQSLTEGLAGDRSVGMSLSTPTLRCLPFCARRLHPFACGCHSLVVSAL